MTRDMSNSDLFDFDHAYEVCPHCEEEVMLDPELKVQTCPNCGKRIVTCSMCRACDTEDNYCSKCCLSFQAEMENAEQEIPSVNVTELNDDIRACLRDYHFGGTILFAENCRDAEQVLRLERTFRPDSLVLTLTRACSRT